MCQASTSYIRKGKYRPATRTTPTVSRSGYPLDGYVYGLEISGRRHISVNVKNKRITFLAAQSSSRSLAVSRSVGR